MHKEPVNGRNGFSRDRRNNAGSLNRRGDVMNKENQHADAAEGQHKGEEHGQPRDKFCSAAATDGAQHNQAIDESSGKGPERPLGDLAAHEVAQDARSVLTRSEYQRNQGHRKGDAQNGHHRTGQRRQHLSRTFRPGSEQPRPVAQPTVDSNGVGFDENGREDNIDQDN